MATNNTTSTAMEGMIYREIPAAVLLDGVLQSFLLGFVFGQASKYFSEFQDDSLWKKIYVGVVVFLSLFQTVVEDYKLWIIAVEHARWTTHAFAWSGVIVNGCISWLCEMFFIKRCWKITGKNPWVLYPLSTLATTLMVVNIYFLITLALTVAMGGQTRNAYKGMHILNPSIEVVFTIWTAGSVFLDLAVALILIIVLWRSKTGSKGSDYVVNTVIAITLESAVPPCLSMVAAICLSYSHREDNIILSLVILSGKLYSLGLLRTLNARDGLRRRIKSHDLGRVTLGNWQWEQAETVSATGVAESFKTVPPNSISESPRGSTSTSIGVGRCYPESIGPHEELAAVASGVAPMSPEVRHNSPSMNPSEKTMSRSRNSSSNYH